MNGRQRGQSLYRAWHNKWVNEGAIGLCFCTFAGRGGLCFWEPQILFLTLAMLAGGAHLKRDTCVLGTTKPLSMISLPVSPSFPSFIHEYSQTPNRPTVPTPGHSKVNVLHQCSALSWDSSQVILAWLPFGISASALDTLPWSSRVNQPHPTLPSPAFFSTACLNFPLGALIAIFPCLFISACIKLKKNLTC